ncbi:hypothetical protein KKG85_01120 [Patescibacteria group bacterium]|nr:hypothetical protein [Patescibacteria group bacterium]MBU2579647.1 hypothetical protein [Patescibacteria group bacterium]
MVDYIKKLLKNCYKFGRKEKDTKPHYGSFYAFSNYSPERQKEILTQAAKEANKEQRDLINRYDKTIKPIQKD